MTSYPTLLGTGGHYASGQTYNSPNYYCNVGLGRCAMETSGITTESYVSQTLRVRGTISYLSWALDNNTFDAALTLTLSVNSSSGGLAISIPAMTTGWVTDGTDSVSVFGGDKLDFVTNVGATVSGYTGGFYCVSARLDAAPASAQMLATVGPGNFFATAQRFVNFLGILGPGSAIESQQQFKCLAAGTWQNMACHVEGNSFNQTLTVHNRKNGSNGSMVISILVNHSGYFEDVTDSDHNSVSVGDLLDYAFVTSATSGVLNMDWIGAQFLATDTALCMIGGSEGSTEAIASGTTDYCSLFGGGEAANPPINPQTRATGLFPYALSATSFTNFLPGPGTGSGAATFTLLINGSPTLAVSSGLGNTGYFTDTDVIAVAVGDTCANQIVVTSGTVTWASAALLLKAD